MASKSFEEQARGILNASGFVFQLGVAHEVRSGMHGWSVRAEEHPYHASPTIGGHIDLILEKDAMVLVVECKRTRDGIWAFIAKKGGLARRHARWLRIASRNGRKQEAWWQDITTEPSSPEVVFCAVRGSEDRQAPMLGSFLRSRTSRPLESPLCTGLETIESVVPGGDCSR